MVLNLQEKDDANLALVMKTVSEFSDGSEVLKLKNANQGFRIYKNVTYNAFGIQILYKDLEVSRLALHNHVLQLFRNSPKLQVDTDAGSDQKLLSVFENMNDLGLYGPVVDAHYAEEYFSKSEVLNGTVIEQSVRGRFKTTSKLTHAKHLYMKESGYNAIDIPVFFKGHHAVFGGAKCSNATIQLIGSDATMHQKNKPGHPLYSISIFDMLGQILSLIAENISRFCYIFTIVFNSSLIVLTTKYTQQIVGTYRNMIVTFASFGILFSTADILVRPLFHSHNGCIMYFTLGSAFGFSKRVTEFVLLMYAGLYTVILAFLTIQFVYRASLLSKTKRKYAKLFDGYKLIIWIIYSLLIATMWGSAICLISSDSITDEYLRDVIRNNYGVEIRNIPNYPLLAYNGEGSQKNVRWNSVIFVCIVTTIMGFHYSIMMVCGYFMYQRTKQNLKSSSTAYEKLQKQFFQALIYQTLAPTFVFHLPIFIVLVAPFFDFKFSFNTSFVVHAFSAYPLVDSLIVLNVVTEYKYARRRFLSQLIRGFIGILGEDTPRGPDSRTDGVRSQA